AQRNELPGLDAPLRNEQGRRALLRVGIGDVSEGDQRGGGHRVCRRGWSGGWLAWMWLSPQLRSHCAAGEEPSQQPLSRCTGEGLFTRPGGAGIGGVAP